MNIIEKVARALKDTNNSKVNKNHFEVLAKAAIEAMKEPSEGMYNAGTSDDVHHYYKQLIQAALEGK